MGYFYKLEAEIIKLNINSLGSNAQSSHTTPVWGSEENGENIVIVLNFFFVVWNLLLYSKNNLFNCIYLIYR